MIDIILVGLVSIGVFALFIFVAVRESAINKKLKTYEKTIDLLHKEMFVVRKELKSIPTGSNQPLSNDKFATAEEFEAFTNIIISKLQEIQSEHHYFKTNIQDRISDVESREKMSSVPIQPTPSSGGDEQKIISLFESGYSPEDIAKQLRLNTGEVEFVLKLNNVKSGRH